MKSYEFFGIYDFTEIAEELTTEELFLVNGGDCGAGSACASRVKQSCTGIPSCTKDTPPGCGNNPPPVNPLCGNTPPLPPGAYDEDNNKFTKFEKMLRTANEETLGNLLNTDNLSDIIVNNLDKLDKSTRDYFESMSADLAKETIQNILDNVTVYTDVKNQQTVFDLALGKNNGVNPKDGLTLGNDIYLVDTIINMDKSTADLLGHEAIHVLQSFVTGEEKFIKESSIAPYTPQNSYEDAAYKFGGNGSSDGFTNSKDQVFNQNENINWWKK